MGIFADKPIGIYELTKNKYDKLQNSETRKVSKF